MTAPWRNCAASVALIGAVNSRWPSRSKISDGTIGDLAHQKAGTSDHLPNAQGVVRARDITASGIDAPWLAEHIRILGAAGDPRLTGGGYVIFNSRITTPDWRGWKVYTGRNPHIHHVHVSFSRIPAGYDSAAPWPTIRSGALDTPTPLRPPSPAPREDFLMALTDAEQREILDGMRRLKPGIVLPARSDHAGPRKDDAIGAAFNAWAEAADASAGVERVEAIVRSIAARAGAGPAGPPVLTDADRRAIAVEVVGLLTTRLAS